MKNEPELCSKLMPFAEAEIICHALGKERLEQIGKEINKEVKLFCDSLINSPMR